MKIHETLRELRRTSGLSQVQAAQFLTDNGASATQKAVSRWECGASQPSIDQFLLLCRLYRVQNVLSVFGAASEPDERLNALGKKRLLEYARLLASDAEFSVPPREDAPRPMRTIPLYDLPVSAGSGQFLDSDSYELIDADDTVPLSATFAVRIHGDSMTPRFANGRVVYVKQQQTLSQGEVGIFLINGDAYCKLLSTDDGVELISLNPKYPPIIVGEYDEFRVLGKVVGQSMEK